MSKRTAIFALLLLVPTPSVGALFGMIICPDTTAGALIFAMSKLWLFGLPVVWLRFVEHMPFSFSPPRHGGFAVGLFSGLLISGVMLTAYLTMGDSLIDAQLMKGKLTAIGLGTPGRYFCGAAYWILVNSVLEEYVWRWFCVRQCEQLFPKHLAVVCSALFFTLHHVVALQVYLGPVAVLICALGVFSGGAIWSMMYIRYRSIWPGYLSHAIVDVCVFGIGAYILLGTR